MQFKRTCVSRNNGNNARDSGKKFEMRGHRNWQSSEGNRYFFLDMRIYFIFDIRVLRLVVIFWYTRDVCVRKIYINSFANGKAAAAGLNFHESRWNVRHWTGCGFVKKQDIHRSGIMQLGKPEKQGVLSHNFHSSSHVIFQNFIYFSRELSQQWCVVNG